MNVEEELQRRKQIGRRMGIAIVAGAVLAGLAVLWQTNVNPRTDDARCTPI